MPNIELSLRDGFAIDRAENTLAHAIAILNNDWAEATKLAREVRADAINSASVTGLVGRQFALAVICHLDQSRSRLPV